MTMTGMRGVEVPASVGGRYLGDDFFLPFWAAAADAGAVVFVHPTTTGLGIPALDGQYLWNSVGNPLETAIAAAQLVVSGILDRFPGLIVLLAHGGGALMSLRGRLRHAFAVRPEARPDGAGDPDLMLRLMYYDSLTHDLSLLRDLVRFAGPEHVLLGSDRPFDMGAGQARRRHLLAEPEPHRRAAAAGWQRQPPARHSPLTDEVIRRWRFTPTVRTRWTGSSGSTWAGCGRSGWPG